jgi:NAD+ synthase (glutamine-hydrolysing)
VWFLANLENKLLMATSNLSEAVVGYCTMDGDTSGVLSPIGGLPKTRVLKLLDELGTNGFEFNGEYLLLPTLKAISQQKPSAELRPEEQRDEADLMPYTVLDSIRVLSQVAYLERTALLKKLSTQFSGQYSEQQLSDWYQRYQQLAVRSQWKRERLAPAFHLEEDSACPKTYRRWPII